MNLVITSTTNAIKVNFNDTPAGSMTQGIWRKDKVISFGLYSDYVYVITQDVCFQVADTAVTGCFVVDSVDGVAPSSLADLYAKLSALLG